MQTIITFAVFGAVTGALSAAILLAFDFKGNSLYVVPGLVFGIAFAMALWQRWRLPPARAIAYLAAVSLANAAAVFTGIFILDEVATIVGKGASTAITGVIAGAIGAGLATGAAGLLMSITRWPWPRDSRGHAADFCGWPGWRRLRLLHHLASRLRRRHRGDAAAAGESLDDQATAASAERTTRSIGAGARICAGSVHSEVGRPAKSSQQWRRKS
jgi:hypothetical protein